MILNNLIIPYDYILLAILFIIVLFSFWKGFIKSILGLLTWIGSILITIYSYSDISDFFNKILINIKFLQNYENITLIVSIIISIPLIFLISLFILKKIRKLITSDLDKQILGRFFDKFFGLIYGFIFFYAIITAILILFERFELKDTDNWVKKNSILINEINIFNDQYIYKINKIEGLEELE